MVLEELIDRVKPPERAPAGLHYLLSTPFRYPPLRHGSRFGSRHERGIWYGSTERRTAFAEVAYYRLLFLEGSHAPLGLVTTPLTAFTVRMRSARGIDLVAPPFASHRRAISSPASYASSQALGSAMRRAAVELCTYASARDDFGGVNVAAFSPDVFGSARPQRFETWHCTAERERVELAKSDFFTRETFAFPRRQFLVRGSLPAPAL